MPIFLWSTVVSHDRQPDSPDGRVNAPSGLRTIVSSPAVSSRTGRSSVRAMRVQSLLQRLEEGVEAVDLVLAELADDHERAGLALRVAQPRLDLVPVGEV